MGHRILYLVRQCEAHGPPIGVGREKNKAGHRAGEGVHQGREVGGEMGTSGRDVGELLNQEGSGRHQADDGAQGGEAAEEGEEESRDQERRDQEGGREAR